MTDPEAPISTSELVDWLGGRPTDRLAAIDIEDWDLASISRSAVDLLRGDDPVYVLAPMVRYSRLPFRELVREYGVHIAYTPMIISDAFAQSQVARDIQLSISKNDTPLVVQFAASNAADFANAVAHVAPYVAGVDLNCGCPQSWVMQCGYGARLLRTPELICDMVRAARALPGRASTVPVSVKIRIDEDLAQTVELARRAEAAGAAWIAVHGRLTPQRSSTPPNLDAIRLVKESVSIPVIANGDVDSLAAVDTIRQQTGVNAFMSARPLLTNPALFRGYDSTPVECVRRYLELAVAYGASFDTMQHHVSKMSEHLFSASERRYMHSLTTTAGVVDFFEDYVSNF
ncbi:hypothetical protein H696_03656 [Fonticula alba]|uniref:DUS-like FMN-binding domain-containing protein n=1 Tax=Fonticula alba TaxID=691883 RepID=A0A058Z8E8_FONAL|nr:hypothetical protein H696_03656 [Fonticula alba]KCV70198.1 hypothetical protein H696_03656 [Fonticula alba]|eukprot:XP_009495804.1 hypothetical protein H696_03656 [Fonticula alba]